jgi:hypothetical protein
MRGRLKLLAAGFAILAMACSSNGGVTRKTPGGRVSPAGGGTATLSGYHPVIDPATFGSVIDNPYFPLAPGTTYVYEGVRDGAPQRDVFVVTGETRVIMGVTTVVVRDTATRIADGTVIERTDDWFAQDRRGNVWYMGEGTKLFDAKGRVTSTEGSWEGGVDGALPGIVMPAIPQAPSTYRQEFYVGHAQDTAWLVDLAQSVTVPAGTYPGALETLEWSPLEPNVIEKKYYASGVGLVLSTSAAGEVENAKLVSVSKP